MAQKISINELKKIVKKTLLNETGYNEDLGSSKEGLKYEFEDFKTELEDTIDDFMKKYSNLFEILHDISDIFSQDFSLKNHLDKLESDMETSKKDLQDNFDYFTDQMRTHDLKYKTEVILNLLETLEDYHNMTDRCFNYATNLLKYIKGMEPSEIVSEINVEDMRLAPY